MYDRVKKLAEYILNAERDTFSLAELFEVVTGAPAELMGKKSDRHIAMILSRLGFKVTIHSYSGKVDVTVESTLSPEEVMEKASDFEWERYRKASPPPPVSMIQAYRNLPAILRQIEVMSRKGLPVEKEDLERLCKLAGYRLQEKLNTETDHK